MHFTDSGRQAALLGSESFNRIQDRWTGTVGEDPVQAAEQALAALRDALRATAAAAAEG